VNERVESPEHYTELAQPVAGRGGRIGKTTTKATMAHRAPHSKHWDEDPMALRQHSHQTHTLRKRPPAEGKAKRPNVLSTGLWNPKIHCKYQDGSQAQAGYRKDTTTHTQLLQVRGMAPAMKRLSVDQAK
jgi:hypothetical protein